MKMKKLISSITAITMAAALFTACADNGGGETTTTPAAGGGETTTGSITAGFSTYNYLTSSRDATDEATGRAEVNSYIAYTAVDADGKIVKAGIDAIQSRISFDTAGQIVDTDLTTPVQTKNEKGDAYNMKPSSGIGKEWYEQAQALADWSVGKTLADVKNAAVTDGKFSDADLVSSVTVTAVSMQTPLAESGDVKIAGTIGSGDKIGMGTYTTMKSSKSATDEATGQGQVDSMVALIAVDSSGKITACGFDAIQSKVVFDNTGVISTDLTEMVPTKAEKGDAYGMRGNSAIGKEWNEQAASFAEWCIGKTVAEVVSMTTKEVDANHPQVPDVADLNSSVTITVGDFLKAIEKAGANAK